MNIGQEVLKLLKKEITQLQYNRYIKQLVYDTKKSSSDLAIFYAPNALVCNWIKSKYSQKIEHLFEIKNNSKVSVSIRLKNSTERRSKKQKNEQKIQQSLLNPSHTFNNFMVGGSNQFAYAAAKSVSEKAGETYNPLFIYGGVGLGKTHLMHAIGHYVKNQNKNANIIYVTSEKFTNDLINSIKDDKNVEFRNKYRKADILLVDDIQFIAGKERTQEEFFHTFNALHEANKQIVLSSDRPPKEIQTLEARLRSRFEWGLITDIQAPDYETRVAILQKKAEHDNVYIPNDVFTFIASKIKSNIRELEGALIRVVAYSSLTNKEISVELSNEALKDIISDNKPRKITVDLIIDVICKNYNITPKELISKRRSRNISFPRQIAMYICRDLTDLSLPKIGEEFGGRDHTTVIHAKDKINTQMKEDFDFNNTVKNLIKEIVGD